MKPLRIALNTSSASEADRLAVHDALSLATLCAGEPWQFVDSSSYYGILCLWIKSAEDLPMLRSAEKRCPADRLIVLSLIELESHAKWKLHLPKGRNYPDALSLADLLRRVQQHLQPETCIQQNEMFDPGIYFGNILELALEDGLARVCMLQDRPPIYLLPNEDTVYMEGTIDLLLPFAVSKADEVKVETMTDEALLEKVGYVKFSSRIGEYASFMEGENFSDARLSHYSRFGFAHARWYAAIAASRGRLVQGAVPQQKLRLSEPPDFIGKYHENLLPLFERLRELPLEKLLASEKQHSDYEIINLYNGCLTLAGANPASARGRAEKSQSLAKKHYTVDDLYQYFDSMPASVLAEKGAVVIAGESAPHKSLLSKTFNALTPTDSDAEQTQVVLTPEKSLFVYEFPEYAKFDFAEEMIAESAWGLLVTIDNSKREPFMELDAYLKLCRAYFSPEVRVVIALVNCEPQTGPSLEEYVRYLDSDGKNYPVLAIDPANASDAAALLMELAGQRIAAGGDQANR